MRHTIRHELEDAQARRLLDLAFDSYRSRYSASSPMLDWQDGARARFSFSVKGRTLHGDLTLAPGAFEVDLQVPLLLRPFEARARRAIDDEVRRWVTRAQAGDV